MISKIRFLAQSIASSWLSTQTRTYTSPSVGVQDHGPVLLVDPHRADLVVLDIVDFLVVDAGRLRVGLELLGELPDLPLLGTGNAGEGVEEVAAEGHGGGMGSLLQGVEELLPARRRGNTFHPWLLEQRLRLGLFRQQHGHFFEGQASSASAQTRPCSS